MGASEAFEGDIEAAARTVLQEAGGQRAKAKELLRRRINGNGASATASSTAARSATGGSSARCRCSTIPRMRSPPTRGPPSWRPSDAEAQMLVGVLNLRSGNLAAAETAFRRQIEIGGANGASFLRYRGHTMLGDVHAAREDHDAALAAYAEAPARGQGAAGARARQCRLQARPVGDLRPHRRHAPGERPARRGARELPPEPGDRRGSGQARPAEPRLAARSVREPRPHRRGSGQERRPRGGARELPQGAWRSRRR